MTNTLFKVNNSLGTHFMAIPFNSSSEIKEILNTLPDTEFTSFEVGTVNLEELPENTQKEVKSILKAFDEVTVTYERSQFTVSTGTFISAHYPTDHFVCGTYYQKKVYTPEERKTNFLEEFGYLPRIPNYFN